MDCLPVRELLHQSLDGAAAGSALRDHLAVCAACRSQLTALRRTTDLLGTLTNIAAPPNLLSAVMTAVQDRHRAKSSPGWWHQTVSFVATSAAIVGLILVVQSVPLAQATSSQDVPAFSSFDDAVLVSDARSGDAALSLIAATADPLGFAQEFFAGLQDSGTLLLGLCLLFVSGTAMLVLLLPADLGTAGPLRYAR